MAFTEVELAILSQAAYLKLPDGAERQPLHEFLSKDSNYNYLLEKLGPDYKEHIDGLLKKIEDSDYRIVRSENDADGTGFAAFAIAGPDNDVTVVCRGTENFTDIVADGELTVSAESRQQEQMRIFVEDLEALGYDPFTFTGHSLGGNLAMYGAIILSNPDKLHNCTTFNAPGFNSAFLSKNQFRISRIQGRMVAFQNERDFVSESMIVPGKIITLECEGWDVLHITGWRAHGMNTLIPNEDGGFKRNRTGKKDMTILGLVFDGATDLTNGATFLLSPIITTLDFIKWKINQESTYCRDFSAEAKNMLLSAAKETEEEKWWQITRWDCWYRIDNLFGGLAADWNKYTGDVDTYYRKLIDVNDASSKDIEKIFSKVYEIDHNHANAITNIVDSIKANIFAKLEEIRDAINPTYVHNNTTFSTVEQFGKYSQKQKLSSNCTSTAWCMGLSMITGESYDPTKPPYWGDGGAIYVGYSKVISRNPLTSAYDELQNGKPSMFYAYNGNSTSGNHAVVIVGVAEGADRNNLQPGDFLVIDPADGRTKNLTEVGYLNYNGTLYTYKDNP